MKGIAKRLISIVIAFIIIAMEFSAIGIYAISYATNNEDNQYPGNDKISYDVFFENHETTTVEDINSEGFIIYMKIRLREPGYLKNAEINFKGPSGANFTIDKDYTSDYVQEISEENQEDPTSYSYYQTIKLNQINSNDAVVIEIPVKPKKFDYISVHNFNYPNIGKLSGTFVNSQGEELDVNLESNFTICYHGEAEIEGDTEVTKLVPYHQNEEYGVLLQYKIRSNLKDFNLPISKSEYIIEVPQINDVEPSNIDLMRIDNQKDEKIQYKYKLSEWEYDEEEKTIAFEKIIHPDKNSMTTWNKSDANEYLVTVIYEGNEIYNYALANELDLDLAFGVRITAYNDVETIREKWIRKSVHLDNSIGNITDLNIVNCTDKLSKGYMYANYDATEKIETEYDLKYVIDISRSEMIQGINIIQGNDIFIDKTETSRGNISSNEDSIYIKEISVNEDLFADILGEDGNIKVVDENGVIGRITYENNTLDCSNSKSNHITLSTTSPITNGTLVINVKKAIKGENRYTEETLKTIIGLSNNITGTAGSETINANSIIELTEPTSKAKITINPEQLSTIVENKDVEIRAILDTSDVNNSLYKNPTIRICFPKYIKQVNIKSAMLLFEEELKVVDMRWENKSTGKEFVFTLEGEQTKYNVGAVPNGATISLIADITLDSLTPSKVEDIKIEVTNENVYNEEQLKEGEQVATVASKTEMEYVAPTGIVASTSVTNYMDGAEEVMSMSSEKQTVSIKTGSEARTVSTKAKIINNYNDSISNVVILGRLPFKNNKQIDTTEDLGTTFDMPLKSRITVTGSENIKIYYSTNGNATKDLQNTSNGWIENPEDLSNIKSYLIVLGENELEEGSILDFSYNAEIPANLYHNNNAFGTYKVYYNLNEETGTHEESKLSSLLGFTTGQGPDLKVELKSNMKNVRNGQIVKLTAVVENIGEVAAENVNININAPEGTTLVEMDASSKIIGEIGQTKKVTLNTVNPGEKIIKQYDLKILPETEETEIENQVCVSADDISEVRSNICILNVTKGYLSISHGSSRDGSTVLKLGDMVKFYVEVSNISNERLKNVVYTFDVPKEFEITNVKYISSHSDGKMDDGVQVENNKITISLGDMGKKESFIISIDTYVKRTSDDEEINVFSEAIADGIDKHYSNEIVYSFQSAEAKISLVSLSDQAIKANDDVKYKINVATVGEGSIRNIKIVNLIPSEFEFIKAEISYKNEKYEITTLSNNKLEISSIEFDGEINIEVYLKAKAIEGDDAIEIVTYSSLRYDGKDEIKSNKIRYYLEPSSQEENPGRYKISGTAWLDENKDGQRDEDEEVMSNMEVLLLYKNSNEVVLDEDLNTEKRVTTDSYGKYQFTNLLPGEYYVVFLYESGKYDITKYHAEDVDVALNCDAIAMETVIDGKNRNVGISDIIKISDKSLRNIDIGLCIAEKFDLSLEKYITKISLTTPTIGTKVYNYDNSKLAKIDVLKDNVGKSDIVIEYKIVVKNEGAIPGYVKKIIDYVPSGTKFNSELNTDWLLANDGNVYCYSLSNTKINPGETKEVSLILTCNITESVIGGILNNNAEIYEAYNDRGLRDVDSIPNDKVQTEDDMSNADVALSITTGKVATYTTLIVLIILLLISSIYIIKKFVLDVEN